MSKLFHLSIVSGVMAAGTLMGACTQTDTGGLTVGECVHVDPVDFTFGGDVGSAGCDGITFVNDVYRVVAIGSEAEMDRTCDFPNLIIVDGDDAACLGK